MSTLCIIPARGGSKRIPRKNIKNFLGKPIIEYSIQAALESSLFDEVMVSTDDKEIAEIAEKSGAKVPFLRSSENANDFASTVDVLYEVIDRYKKRGQHFDSVCCIYPTAPLIKIDHLKEAYALMIENKFDCVFPVTPFSYPVQRALIQDKDGTVKMAQQEFKNSRSQDLVPHYHDCGQFYWFKADVILNERKIWTDNTGSIILSNIEVQDIDEPSDWQIAELKYKYLNE